MPRQKRGRGLQQPPFCLLESIIKRHLTKRTAKPNANCSRKANGPKRPQRKGRGVDEEADRGKRLRVPRLTKKGRFSLNTRKQIERLSIGVD